jgi:hypothetical protein
VSARGWFALGLVLGGISTAMLACLAGSLVRPLLPAVAVAGALAVLLLFVLGGELGLHRELLPHNQRQVPQTVIGDGGRLGALRFGYEMGTGVRTFMPSNLPYLALAAVVLIAPAQAALLVGTGFGLGRAWMTLSRTRAQDASAWDAAWRRLERPVRATLALVAAAALAALALQTLPG